jgi:hypothetical protein
VHQFSGLQSTCEVQLNVDDLYICVWLNGFCPVACLLEPGDDLVDERCLADATVTRDEEGTVNGQ